MAQPRSTVIRNVLIAAFAAVGLSALMMAPAHAYIGPGAGISMLGALWAVIAGIVLAIAGLLIWPIRALLRRRKAQAEAASASTMAEAGDAEGSSTTSS